MRPSQLGATDSNLRCWHAQEVWAGLLIHERTRMVKTSSALKHSVACFSNSSYGAFKASASRNITSMASDQPIGRWPLNNIRSKQEMTPVMRSLYFSTKEFTAEFSWTWCCDKPIVQRERHLSHSFADDSAIFAELVCKINQNIW
mgnify:CR=1 FL=1